VNTPFIIYLGSYLFTAIVGAIGTKVWYRLGWMDSLILSNGCISFCALAACGIAYSGNLTVPFYLSPAAIISVGIAVGNQYTSHAKVLQTRRPEPNDGNEEHLRR